MYRQYENPITVQAMLDKARREYEEAKATDPDNIDRLIDLSNEVAALEERVNFAWQDEEYDENY